MREPMHSITLDLPDTVIHRAQQAAQALDRPLEEVVASLLAASLPDLSDVPLDMHTELAQMTWMTDQELLAAVQSQMSAQHQTRLAELSAWVAERPLSAEEQRELEDLRQEYGRVTLRKARAYALLSLRSGRALLARH